MLSPKLRCLCRAVFVYIKPNPLPVITPPTTNNAKELIALLPSLDDAPTMNMKFPHAPAS